MLQGLKGLPKKLLGQAALLRRDPERFARNVTQFTNPALFEERLVNVLNAVPMHVICNAAVTGPPMLNILDAAWTRLGMTGGPNTVINLVCRVAQQGVPVRLVSTVNPSTIDAAWFHQHAAGLLGTKDFPTISIVSAAQAALPLQVSPRDMFLATHWTTAQQLKSVLPHMAIRQFFYMLQEFEPAFYAWSNNFALAIETLGFDFWPIVNEALLAEYLFTQPIGRLSDPVLRERAVVFEPAVDAALFHPGQAAPASGRRRLLFYARPTNSRNLFGLGLLALRRAVADPAFAEWEFLSIGGRGSVPDLPLGHGHVLRRAPWMDYAGYGDLLRQADILLCPMLSPHTSYPVLEMVACGGLAVTNIFATKTAAALKAISANIVAVEPTVDGLVDGLLEAVQRANAASAHEHDEGVGVLNMPRDWAVALQPAATRVAAIFRELSGTY